MFRQFYEGDNGKNIPAHMAQFPDALKTNETLAQYKTLGDMGQALLDKDGKVREYETKIKDAVFIPGENAKPEEVSAFYERLGRPKTEADYKFDPVDLPKDKDGKPLMQINDELSKSFLKLAHENGLTNKQAAASFKLYNDHMINTFRAQQEATIKELQASAVALKTEWGDKFDANREIVRRGYLEFGGEEFQTLLDSATLADGTKLGNHPLFMKTFLKIGSSMLDDTAHDGDVDYKKADDGFFNYDKSPKLSTTK